MARLYYRDPRESQKLKTDKSSASPTATTEVRCYTWRDFTQQRRGSQSSNGRMAESTEEPKQVKTLQYTRRGLRMVGDPSLFDLEEPVWHPDEKSPRCDICRSEFTFTHRRHHCRRCGDVVCSDCCEHTPLLRMGYVDPVLVCKKCSPTCKSEEDFMKNRLKLLVEGSYFHLSDSLEPTMTEYHCKLSPDHMEIVISSDHTPIHMKHILEVKTISKDASSPEPSGGGEHHGEHHGRKRHGSHSKSISLELIYKVKGVEVQVTISPAHRTLKKSVEWLRALKKGLIILHSKQQ